MKSHYHYDYYYHYHYDYYNYYYYTKQYEWDMVATQRGIANGATDI